MEQFVIWILLWLGNHPKAVCFGVVVQPPFLYGHVVMWQTFPLDPHVGGAKLAEVLSCCSAPSFRFT